MVRQAITTLMAGGGQCRGGRFADAAVAARDDNFHAAII